MMGSLRSLSVLGLLAAAPVFAQPKSPPPVTPNAMQVASDLVKKAIAKSQQGDHNGAIDLYLQAYQLSPQHALLSNVANEYLEMKKSVEALKYFCMYLEKDPTGTNATYVTSKAKALEIEMGNTDVTDATVCKPKVSAKEDKPVPGPTTPPIEKPPGGGDPGAPLKYAGLGVAAAGAVAVGIGVFFGFKAKQISDDITHHCDGFPPNMCPQWPDTIKQQEADGQSYETKQIVFLVAGGVAVAAGTALYFVGRSKKASSAERMTFVPVATPDSVGFAFGKSF